MKKYLPREFWTRVAKDFGDGDSTGFAPVLHPGTPRWFNKVIDRLQSRTWSQTLNSCSLSRAARVLDVGCGTGRWVRRLEEHGLSVVGIDQSAEMLSLARKRGTLSPLVSGEVQNLPFRDESFEFVSAVTVIQHVRPQEQVRALSEMVRVLRPGGYLFLIELIRGHGLHVFSRLPDDWIAQLSTLGVSLVSWRIAVALSVWAEPLFEKVCPSTLATHGVFLFRKEQTRD